MSKSLGNSLTIRQVLDEYNYEVIKYVMFCKHYTSDIDITDEAFKIAENQLYYFYNTIDRMEDFIKDNKAIEDNGYIKNDDVVSSIVSKFVEAMDDDFNTVLAIANLHVLFKHVNNLIDNCNNGELGIMANTLEKVVKDVKEVFSILGLFTQDSKSFINDIKNKYMHKYNINLKYVENMIEERLKAKERKEYQKADEIRAELDKNGILLKDMNGLSTWDIKFN